MLAAVSEGLEHIAEHNLAEARDALIAKKQRVIDALGEDAFDGDEILPQFTNTPAAQLYLDARQALAESNIAADLEAQIYNDLYTFFSRYYQDGDFISQRRYGRSDKYAIPYNGQEVLFHWANFDQYYVKSGLHFQNYSFTVPGGPGLEPDASVRVRLSKVDVPRDNIKGDKRFFIFAADQSIEWDTATNTLSIPMEYRPLTDEEGRGVGTRNQQEKLLADAYTRILTAIDNPTLKARLKEIDPQKKTDKDRLSYHLNRYAAENTRDFFVHKDLGGFLNCEFDYYLKAEVLRLEDVNFDDPVHARRAAARLKTIRAIGEKIITFLDQLESFQRKLFLKRKFVLQSDYCLTLDKIPAEQRSSFYPEIRANEAQRAEWKKLYSVTITPESDLDKYPHLMVDTALYSLDFKYRLLACFDNLDQVTDGLLVHGENYQALNLLKSKYKHKIKCIYNDPPFNTIDKDFIYKNNYRHSTWNTMISNRIHLSKDFLTTGGIIATAIDDFELFNLGKVLDQSFSAEQRLGVLIVEIKPSGRTNDNFLATSHEYYLLYGLNPESSEIVFFPLTESQVSQYSEEDEIGAYKWRDFLRTGGYSTPRERPNSFYPIYYNPETDEISLEKNESWKEIFPIDSEGNNRVWRKTPPSFQKHLDFGEIQVITNNDGEYKVQIIDRIKSGTRPKSVWVNSSYDAASHGTKLLKKMFKKFKPFTFPKSVYATRDVIYIIAGDDEESLILDIFAGSGTTAQAVRNLNNDDDGKRKYILIEMGEYFDTVLKPRIEKVVFADEWRDGEPILPEGDDDLYVNTGHSHMFRHIRLESYDDTFNNIRFLQLSGPQLTLLDQLPDYTIGYILDHETAGSATLLDIKQITHPFDYKLLVTGGDGILRHQSVDLVTTFNFLIGLTVHSISRFEYDTIPYILVQGINREGVRICVLWRNAQPVEQLDNERDWLLNNVLNNHEYDKLYVNAENTIPNALLIEEDLSDVCLMRFSKCRPFVNAWNIV